MELFGPDFEQYEEVQAELDRFAEAEREAEVTLVSASNTAPYSVPVDKSKAKKERSSRNLPDSYTNFRSWNLSASLAPKSKNLQILGIG